MSDTKKAKSKDIMVTVKVNRGETQDEVFFYHEADPYINRALYTPTGKFNEGEFSLAELEKKEG